MQCRMNNSNAQNAEQKHKSLCAAAFRTHMWWKFFPGSINSSRIHTGKATPKKNSNFRKDHWRHWIHWIKDSNLHCRHRGWEVAVKVYLWLLLLIKIKIYSPCWFKMNEEQERTRARSIYYDFLLFAFSWTVGLFFCIFSYWVYNAFCCVFFREIVEFECVWCLFCGIFPSNLESARALKCIFRIQCGNIYHHS